MKQRKKLTSLLKLKNNAESRFIERIEFNNQRDLEVKTSQQKCRNAKFVFDQIQGSGKKSILKLNKKSASEVRIQKMNDQDYINQLKEKFLYVNQQNVKFWRDEQKKLKIRLSNYHSNRSREHIRNYQIQLAKEESRLRSIVNKCNKLELTERKYLERLKQSQVLEDKAYQYLQETVINSINSQRSRLHIKRKSNDIPRAWQANMAIK